MPQKQTVYGKAVPNFLASLLITDLMSSTATIKIADGDTIKSGEPLYSTNGTDFKTAKFAEYSTAGTYSVGDKVLYKDHLYTNKTRITTAEAFDAAKWTDEGIFDIHGIYLGEDKTASGAELTISEAVCFCGEFHSSAIQGINSEIRKSMFRNKLILNT